MCKIGSNASGVYETPLIDRGRWQVSLLCFRLGCERVDAVVLIQRRCSQIQLVFNDPQFVKLNFFAKQGPDEVLDPTGNRKGTFEITVSVRESDFTIHEVLLY